MDSVLTVSVIVPVYNVERYLKQCIESILKQTYSKLEIILVDDGSTDASGKICDEFMKSDSRIQVIHQQNRGVSAARNAAIDIATGDYLSFVDSDDYVEELFVEKLLRAVQENEADIAVCGHRTVFEDGTAGEQYKSVDEPELSIEKAIAYLLEDIVIRNFVWDKIFKKELFTAIRFPEGKTYEDVAITGKVFLEAKKASSIPDCLYAYRIRPGSITNAGSRDYYGKLQLVNAKIQQIEDMSLHFETARNSGYAGLVRCYINAFSAGSRCVGIEKLKGMDECTDYVWAICTKERWRKLSHMQKIKICCIRFFPKLAQLIFWGKQVVYAGSIRNIKS